MPQRRMQIQSPVGLIAMEIKGDRHHRYLDHDESRQNVTPEGKVKQAVQIFHSIIHQLK
jgi:hypothetical protein